MRLSRDEWTAELDGHDALFAKIGARLPDRFPQQRAALAARFAGLDAPGAPAAA